MSRISQVEIILLSPVPIIFVMLERRQYIYLTSKAISYLFFMDFSKSIVVLHYVLGQKPSPVGVI